MEETYYVSVVEVKKRNGEGRCGRRRQLAGDAAGRKTKMKKNEATLACVYLINQPELTSLIICSTELKAKSTLGA